MSSDDRTLIIENPDGAGMTGVALIAGLLAFLVSAGCGGGSTNNSGGGGGASVRGTIEVGTVPDAVAVDPIANQVYVADSGTVTGSTGPCSTSGAGITVINGATGTTATVPLQATPRAIALNPGSHTAYVAQNLWWRLLPSQDCSFFEALATSIDTPTGLQLQIYGAPLGGRPGLSGIAVDQSTGDIYLTVVTDIFASNSVKVIGSNGATIPVGSGPVGVAVNATTGKIYVANTGSNNISVIDGTTNSVVATITDPNAIGPAAVAVNATTNTIYAANSQSNNVTVIDGATNAVTATIPVGTSPSGVDVDSQTNYIYVANAGNSQTRDPGNVTVINGATNATATLTDPNAKNPVAVAVNSVTNRIYVANSGSNNVTVIDGAHD